VGELATLGGTALFGKGIQASFGKVFGLEMAGNVAGDMAMNVVAGQPAFQGFDNPWQWGMNLATSGFAAHVRVRGYQAEQVIAARMKAVSDVPVEGRNLDSLSLMKERIAGTRETGTPIRDRLAARNRSMNTTTIADASQGGHHVTLSAGDLKARGLTDAQVAEFQQFGHMMGGAGTISRTMSASWNPKSKRWHATQGFDFDGKHYRSGQLVPLFKGISGDPDQAWNEIWRWKAKDVDPTHPILQWVQKRFVDEGIGPQKVHPGVLNRILTDPNLPNDLRDFWNETYYHSSQLHELAQIHGIDLRDPGVHDLNKFTNPELAIALATRKNFMRGDWELEVQRKYHSGILLHHVEWDDPRVFARVGAYDTVLAMHYPRMYNPKGMIFSDVLIKNAWRPAAQIDMIKDAIVDIKAWEALQGGFAQAKEFSDNLYVNAQLKANPNTFPFWK
ncbi:MAG: hypothetical protein ACOYYS_16845, partial [Chloroflexota bacterium]